LHHPSDEVNQFFSVYTFWTNDQSISNLAN